MNAYKKIDLTALKKDNDKTISTKEALKDVTPFSYPEDVIIGKSKIRIEIRRDAANVQKLLQKLQIIR